MSKTEDQLITYNLGYVFNKELTKVYLIFKNKPDCFDYNRFNGLGGKVNPGEDIKASMTREFFEEANVVINDWIGIGTYFGSKGNTNYAIHTYTTTIKEKDLKPFISNEGHANWVNINTISYLEEYFSSNVKFSIPMALDILKNSKKDVYFNIANIL